MDIKEIILHKQALLKAAQDKVAELQQQIATLETIASEDAVDTALASKIKPPVKSTMDFVIDGLEATGKVIIAQNPSAKLQATSGGKNPKGSVPAALLQILADGVEKDLDFIEQEQSKLLPVPITRAAIRTAMLNLKNNGKVTSRKQGVFQLAQKESPAGTGLNATASSQG